MINIMLCGCGGKMGHALTRLIGEDENCAVICGVDINTEKYADYPVYPSCGDFDGKADVIIDFPTLRARTASWVCKIHRHSGGYMHNRTFKAAAR